MSVELNELQESARQVVSGTELPAAEDAMWAQVAELGWLMVSIPEQLGGLDTGAQGACTMHLELGRGLSGAPYIPAMLAIEAACASETLPEKDVWLERLMMGELVTASLATSSITANEGKLSGSLQAVQSADKAGHLLVWTDDKQLLAMIALDQDGVALTEKTTWDLTRRLFDVQLNNAEVGDAILAQGDTAAALIDTLLASRDFALAADAIGGAAALLEATVEYLQTRVQFRRPLAMFQALKHRCADMKCWIEAAQAMLFDSLRQVESNPELLTTKAMSAKQLATSTFATVAEDALQLHGGIGMATEHPCHLFLKRALLSDQLGRGGQTYEVEIGKQLLASL